MKNARHIKRYIGTLVKPGSPDEHIAHPTYDLDMAKMFFAELAAEKWPGWTVTSVQRETEEHNIPKLDPARWAAREAALVEINRRAGCR